ncbi:sugar phosphate isomerase/epimerase family protein [Sediminispirochaeta bajacaliforniensis]|uniref:sugar phosphate isomerase/epimerase family protein n=1 Tax=Sediminispirochaeta bajacaliforniensis TaxID=148 RepID=UPI00036AF82E|nr:sugar phosphate isomerase/epimerase family protein [Sediminispirochaeta bajacaliforniensis]
MCDWSYSLSSADSAPDSAPILLRGGICSNLEVASMLGYQAIEIHTREDAFLDYTRIAETASRYNVTISAVVTGRLNTQGEVNLIDDRPYITQSALAGMHSYIEMAAHLKTNLIIGWLKGRIPDGADRTLYLDRLARNLRLICKAAEEKGVKVFIEVINRYEVNIFTTAKETVEFLDAWEIPNCYVHLDTFHMNIEEEDPVDAIHVSGARLGYFHVADNTRFYPGSGTLDFTSYLSALKDINYAGFISVECLPVPDGKTAAKKALAYLKNIEKEI